jgi:geranylgeranyl reductase
MSLSSKVLVVGGGPAGVIAARSLAQWDVEVMLLERNLSFRKPCGGGVPFSAFEELDIPKTLIEKEVRCIRLVSPMGEKLDIELKDSSIGIVERGKFDSTLRKETEKKGAEILEGEFIGFIGDKRHKVLANIKGEKTEIFTEYVIAADGVNSRVRATLGIKPSKALFTLSERIKGVKTDLCEFWFGSSHAPGFYSWVFPAMDGISAGTASSEPGKVIALFERFREKRGITQEGLRRIYKIPIWEGDLYNKGNVLFAGDSAGQVMPLTYEGIYYAMKSGELAAKAIVEKRAANYKKMWREAFQRRFFLMNRLRKYFYRSDLHAERLVALHKKPEFQEASMKLWLKKDRSREGLQRYIKLFGKFLC